MISKKKPLRIALAQRNYTLGDLEKNFELIEESVERARAENADLVVFSECAISGYLPADMLEREEFIAHQLACLDRVAALSDGALGVLVGFVARSEEAGSKRLKNAAALCLGGKILGTVEKSVLSTDEISDEQRYFSPGSSNAVIEFKGSRLGICIGEAAWHEAGTDSSPGKALVEAGAEVLITLAASPFYLGKPAFRRELLSRHAAALGRAALFVNQVGGQDELVFDGGSFAVDAAGDVSVKLADFAEDFAIFEPETGGKSPDSSVEVTPVSFDHGARDLLEDQAQARKAIVLGLRDYAHKTGFHKAILGLSGGIDSAMCAAVAAEALGPENVLGVAMPTRYTRDISNTDAEDLANTLGIEFLSIPIDATFEAFLQQLGPVFAGRAADVTEENLQARVRGTTLMALSNKLGGLVLAPGNKSEVAMGYSTLYGDMVGAISPLGDCFKTLVYAMARGINADAGRELIPNRTIVRPPSAELKPDQTDQDALPPYEILDGVLAAFMHEGLSADQIIERGFDPGIVRDVLSKLFRAEYKRRQSAPILKITPSAFGPGRRYPLAASYQTLL